MTVETEVANLTTAVDNLTASVNVAKGTLDAKVSDAQTAEANAASHETDALAAKVAAEAAAATANSVVQQDLSALGFDVPHGAVAICPIDPYEHGFVTWPVTGKQSWRSETRATGKYLGVHGTTASAWAVTDAAAGDYYWDSTNGNIYELTGTSGASQVDRAGSANFTARWAVGYAEKIVLLAEGGSPWMSFNATRYGYGQNNGAAMIANTYGSASTNTVTGLVFVSGQLWVSRLGDYNGVQYTPVNWVDFVGDRGGAVAAHSGNGVPTDYKSVIYNGDISNRNTVNLGVSKNDKWSEGIVKNGTNAVAATVLPDAPIKNGVPVPTIAVATDGGLSFIHNDGTVTSRAETEANMETTDVEFIGNSGAYRYQHGWSAGHDARVVYAPAEHLKDTSVLAYNTDLYQSWETPVVGFNKTTYHANALRQMANRTDPNGTSRVIAGDSMGGDRGITRVWHNEANPPASMVAYQADDHTTPPLFGDVKGAFLCEQGQAGVLVGANVASTSFDGTGNLDGFVLDTTGSGATNNNGVGYLDLTAGDVSNNVASYTLTGLVIGQLYGVSFSRVAGGNYSAIFRGGVGSKYTNAAGPDYFEFTATATSHGVDVRAGSSGGNARIDNFSVDAVHPDRSVNGKGLIINGSLTQDADGWVSGFSTTKFFEQPYNPDLDFGTSDFHISALITTVNTSTEAVFIRQDPDPASAYGTGSFLRLCTYQGKIYTVMSGGTTVTGTSQLENTGERLLTLIRRNGVVELWVDGILEATGANSQNLDNTIAVSRIGAIRYGTGMADAHDGKIRRLCIGAGAPSPAQIKVMATWIGDRLEGAFKDMAFVAATGVLHVLTDAYHYEVDEHGAVLKSTPNTETWLKLSASRDGVVRTS